MTHSKMLDLPEIVVCLMGAAVLGLLVYLEIVPLDKAQAWIEAVALFIASQVGLRGGARVLGGRGGPPDDTSPPWHLGAGVSIVFLCLMLTACAPRYTWDSIGWKAEKYGAQGTCITISGGGDSEAIVACGKVAAPGKIAPDVAKRLCGGE